MDQIGTARSSWRTILKELCENPQKKQEIANKAGFVTVRTIDRWISGTSSPQKNDVVRKLALISEELHIALQDAFPEAFQDGKHPTVKVLERATLPSEFYRRVARAYAHVPFSSRRWTIWHLLSSQMLSHLDPDGQGLVLFYVRQSGNAFQFVEGAGTSFWATRQRSQESPQDMLNKESWIVQTAEKGSPLFVQSCAPSQLVLPPSILHHDRIQSMAYFPLHLSGIAVGGLFLGAAREDFFTALRQEFIGEYACLIVMAFGGSDELNQANQESIS